MIWVQHCNSPYRPGVFTPSAGLVKCSPCWTVACDPSLQSSLPPSQWSQQQLRLYISPSLFRNWFSHGVESMGKCWYVVTELPERGSALFCTVASFYVSAKFMTIFLYLFSSNRLRRSWTWLEQASKRPKRNRPHRAQVTPHQLNP